MSKIKSKILYYVLLVTIFLIATVGVTFKLMFYYRLYQFMGG